MAQTIDDVLYSGIKTLDRLRFRAAASGTGCISISIEELNEVRAEIEASQQQDATDKWICKRCKHEVVERICPACKGYII